MKTKLRLCFRFLASYGLSVVLLLLLSVLTFLGTLEQVDQGLYPVQKKYFESLFLVHNLLGLVPVPLPGVYLLLILVFVNLLCGAIVRARKGWRHAGLLVAHVSILALLASSFVSFHFSQRGHVTLYEGDQANEFVSYHEWEIAVAPAKENEPVTEYLIPEDDFTNLHQGRSITVYADALPFDLTLTGYARNAQPIAADAARAAPGKVVDGFLLRVLEPEREVERNVPGIYVAAREKGTGAVHEGILWGLAHHPWTVTAGGQAWTVDLRRCRWSLPFTVRLDKFAREVHPGTGIPRAFISDVTRIDGNIAEQARISMNAPLRHKGYTFYQASWGPADAGPGEPLYSSLAVVRNPADQAPLYTCAAICFGLLVHFCLKLGGYLRTEARRQP